MNIFIVNENPATCAELLMDQHVVKMTLESLQLLYTAARYYRFNAFFLNDVLLNKIMTLRQEEERNPGGVEGVEINNQTTTYRAEKLRYHRYTNGTKRLVAYKPTHVSHPSALWVKKSPANFIWLMTHFAFLCKEYESRFGKEHACKKHLDNLEKLLRYSVRYSREQITGNIIRDNVCAEIMEWLDNNPTSLTAESLLELWKHLFKGGLILSWNWPVVVGTTFRRAIYGNSVADRDLLPNLQKVMRAYRSYYLYKIDTFANPRFKNKHSEEYWKALRIAHAKSPNRIYMLNSQGVLEREILCIDLDCSKVAVLGQSTVEPSKNIVTDFYDSIQKFMSTSRLATVFKEIPKNNAWDSLRDLPMFNPAAYSMVANTTQYAATTIMDAINATEAIAFRREPRALTREMSATTPMVRVTTYPDNGIPRTFSVRVLLMLGGLGAFNAIATPPTRAYEDEITAMVNFPLETDHGTIRLEQVRQEAPTFDLMRNDDGGISFVFTGVQDTFFARADPPGEVVDYISHCIRVCTRATDGYAQMLRDDILICLQQIVRE